MTAETDARIAALLKVPARLPDERFVTAVWMEVEFETRLAAANSRAREDIAWKTAVCAIVLAAFVVLARLDLPSNPDWTVPLLSPAMLGFMLLGLWALTELPASAFSRH
jgi:hypothetical protein